MAELLQQDTKRRTRSDRSSTSSTGSLKNKSPLNKKLKSNEEDEDEVMAALNMAGELKDTLDNILAKVSKIDLINDSVNRIENSISKLEERLSTLEQSQKKALQDIEDLKKTSQFMDDSTTSEFKKVKENLAEVNDKLKNFIEEQDQIKAKIKNCDQCMVNLETKDLYLEAYSRRENIRFLNIEERPDEDTEITLRTFLRDELDIFDYDEIEIQRVHRSGKTRGGKPRAILARFVRYKDVEKILAQGKNLKGTNYQMFPDLPREIVERRRKLLPILKKAKQNKIPASFSKSMPDKLFIRGKEWQVGKELII